jgi:hypothetical protein
MTPSVLYEIDPDRSGSTRAGVLVPAGVVTSTDVWQSDRLSNPAPDAHNVAVDLRGTVTVNR